jgi:hypothetical protein
MRFDDELAEILRGLPANGPLFPHLRTVRSSDRATDVHCVGLGIKGVTLHSYRYAWPNAPILMNTVSFMAGSRVVSNTQDERLLIQRCCPYSVLLADPPPTSHQPNTFNPSPVMAEILPENSLVKLQAL